MKKDSWKEILVPAVTVITIATILICILGSAFGATPEFLVPLAEWLKKPLAEVKVGNLLLAILVINLLT